MITIYLFAATAGNDVWLFDPTQPLPSTQTFSPSITTFFGCAA